ncbi:MAG: 4-(cytidine 5'-diphospho)-2-C-methyl-D-erythritol kinase [Bacteroidia bacterium]|nr:4-(cytidine 5'-diphospho)-2-C-methyl-D-erythritol kinase [Bacteroidia bacterium]
MLHLRPHAKINLGLLIKGKRPDGYHLLETLLVPLPQLRDELWLEPSDDGTCSILLEGIGLDGSPDDNLCVRAWKLLRERVPDLPGLRIRLLKGIPAGAGLGGGSSDAAHTLLGINERFGLGLTRAELALMAARLGADVPFFLYDTPMLATGIGTDLEPWPLELPYRIEVATPPIHSATAAAYRALDSRSCDPARSLREILRAPVSQWPQQLVNDLEQPVFGLYPELAALKADFYARGACYAAMSGSGSAVFGLFGE